MKQTEHNKAAFFAGGVSGRLQMSQDDAGTVCKHKIKNCPWDDWKDLWHCDKLPDDYVCSAQECWDCGKALYYLDLLNLTDEQLLGIVHAAMFMETEKLWDMVDKYRLRPKPPHDLV